MRTRSQRLVVGLDVGTTSSKAVVYDEHGAAVATGRAPTTWAPTASGAEIDARDLLEGAAVALARALEDAPAGKVAGIGVASMGESGVLLDGSGSPWRPWSPGTTPGTRRSSPRCPPSSASGGSRSGPGCPSGTSGR